MKLTTVIEVINNLLKQCNVQTLPLHVLNFTMRVNHNSVYNYCLMFNTMVIVYLASHWPEFYVQLCVYFYGDFD